MKLEQSKRILYIIQYVMQDRRFTSKMLVEHLKEIYDLDITLRTIQRDLSELIDAGFLYLFKNAKKGDGVEYKYLNNNSLPSGINNLNVSAKLSLHFLKAHLRNFKGTVIEKQIGQLNDKIEKVAPGNILLEDMLYWNRNIGDYNYSKCENIIENIVYAIENEIWLKLGYKSEIKHTTKTHEIFPARIYSYNGILYLIAYFPKYENYSLMAIQNIQNISQLENRESPKVKFDFQSFVDNRFAVYGGWNETVKLKINKEFEHYFTNRHWHNTQEFSREDGNLILQFKSPVSIDLISMILSWGEGVEVVEPKELRDKVVEKLKSVLKIYE